MAELTITTNAAHVAQVLEQLNDEIKLSLPTLFKQVGPKLVADTRARIKSQGDGKWEKASKWTRARTGHDQVLEGAEEFVKFRQVGQTGAELYGDTGKDWTLTQHHEGFQNEENRMEGDRVVVDIVNPGALGLGSVPNGKFSWVQHGNNGRTPARQIWPTEAQAGVIVSPIAQRWLEALVKRITEANA